MASVVKASFKGIMKRLTYGTEEANFDGLMNTLKESFSIAEGAKLRILYTDSDGDKVLLSDKEDLKDALKNQKLNPLYLEVTIIKEAKPEAKPEAKTAAGGPDIDPLVALFGNMNNWTSGEGKERLRKFASKFNQADFLLEVGRHFNQDFNLENILNDPAVAAGSSDLMEKIVAGVSAAAAAATNAAAAASSSKEGPKETAKPDKSEKTEKKTEEKTEKKTDEKTDKKTEEKTTDKKTEKEPEKKTEQENSEEKATESVHAGVQCDVCSMIPIKGTRYKSMDQHDYDLCQACMDAYPNKAEQFTRIEHPLYRPRGHFGPGFRGGRGGPRYMPSSLQFGGRPFTCGNNASNRWVGRHWGPPSAVEAKPDARFVKDVTIYDGTEMVPGTPFTKIWRFRNVGTTAWPQGTRIVKVGGDSLAEQETFELQISENGLAPGEEVDVAANLRAPEKPGRYVTHFRLATPQGVRFGHRMWALIHVLDKDEESPLVADSKAEDVTPSALAVPAPDKEPAKETSDDVRVIPVKSADVTTEETAVVVTAESPTTEPTNLGDDGFMKVEQADTKSPEDPSPEETVVQGSAPTLIAADSLKTADTASPEKALSAAEDVSAEQVVPESVVENKAPEQYKEQLAKLAELGFSDGAQNVALLEKYGGDLPKTINDLVTVNEWDPMLQELEEMGFYDKELNRSLIYKNNGRLQRVVKDLVQIYKAGPSA